MRRMIATVSYGPYLELFARRLGQRSRKRHSARLVTEKVRVRHYRDRALAVSWPVPRRFWRAQRGDLDRGKAEQWALSRRVRPAGITSRTHASSSSFAKSLCCKRMVEPASISRRFVLLNPYGGLHASFIALTFRSFIFLFVAVLRHGPHSCERMLEVRSNQRPANL
jgi:hypothetical protein